MTEQDTFVTEGEKVRDDYEVGGGVAARAWLIRGGIEGRRSGRLRPRFAVGMMNSTPTPAPAASPGAPSMGSTSRPAVADGIVLLCKGATASHPSATVASASYLDPPAIGRDRNSATVEPSNSILCGAGSAAARTRAPRATRPTVTWGRKGRSSGV